MPSSAPPKDPELLRRLETALAPGFVVEAEVGRGGMGIVYRARDARLKRAVAIKLLPPELAFRDEIKSRFLREAEMAAQLSHPNIVPIYTVDERDGLVYFVMAFIEGDTLAQRLATRGRLTVPEGRTLLHQVADALAYAHSHGVIHRDIKPDNIMLAAGDSRAMVTDFGIARAADDSSGTRLTATGVAMGTPAYMSPEQCTGDREIDGRSDLYSLGVVTYTALSGAPPFSGANMASLLVKHVTERPRPLAEVRPDVPPDLAFIVMRLLEKNPADRFQDAATVVNALDNPQALPPSPPIARLANPEPSAQQPPWSFASAQRPSAPPPPPAPSMPASPPFTEMGKKIRLKDRTDPEGLNLRASKFRKEVVSYAGFSALFIGINVLGGMHSWHQVWFPWVTMWWGFGVIKHAGDLWGDGINPIAALRGWQPGTGPRGSLPSGHRIASHLVAAEVLNGPYGAAVRRATGDHAAILDHIAKLKAATPKGSGSIPDVLPTANDLVDQIASLAEALHRIDVETPPAVRPQLAERRVELLGQLERASLALQNLALDLLRLRSAGVEAGVGNASSATEQARALSKEIGYALSAADELRSNK